jgi:DNA polymerase I-like protein with 3'-5' exonuclease and polymerase domains
MEINNCLLTMEKFGYIPKKKGNQTVLQQYLADLESKQQVRFPRTEGVRSVISTKAEFIDTISDKDEFLTAYSKHKTLDKLVSFVTKINNNCIYPRYNTLVRTGRTSSYGPNIQQLPRAPGVREIFIPRNPDSVLIASDFNTIELLSLAQCCIDKFGHSRMGDLINQGMDLHKAFASEALEKPISDVTKSDRNMAKAFNFGKPGGLGTRTFITWAKAQYGVELTEERANELHRKWLQTFPEMEYWLRDEQMELVDTSLSGVKDPEIAKAMFRKIVQGITTSVAGNPYSDKVVAWAQQERRRIKYTGRFLVELRTGMRRANCMYTDSRNTPFQGTCAAGAKLALWNVFRAGLCIVAFIHDEILVESPECNWKQDRITLENEMVRGMKTVMPDMKVAVTTSVMRRWIKGAKEYAQGVDACEVDDVY